jgi:hypothetical protein
VHLCLHSHRLTPSNKSIHILSYSYIILKTLP